jgi:hypothetical protein
VLPDPDTMSNSICSAVWIWPTSVPTAVKAFVMSWRTVA